MDPPRIDESQLNSLGLRNKDLQFNGIQWLVRAMKFSQGRKIWSVGSSVLFLNGWAAAVAVEIVFPDFSDLSSIQRNGSAASIGNPVNSGGANVLRLTDNLVQSGSAFLKDPIALQDGGGFQASFSTFFAFRISDPQGIRDSDGQGADGIAFVVQTVANNVGGAGGGIGYAGISSSVGIEYDTWDNGSFANDPNGNHVGIDLGGNIASVQTVAVAERMNDGQIWYSWVDYNGDADLLEVRLSLNPARPVLPLLSRSVDLVAELGTPNAYVGFTSGTGSAGGDHDILRWSFRSTHAPIDVIPEASTVVAGIGMIGLVSGMLVRNRLKR